MQKRELRRAVFGDESCIGRLPWLNTAVLVYVGVTVVSFVLLQIAPVLTWMAKTPLYHISTYLGLIGAVLMALDLFTNRGLWRGIWCWLLYGVAFMDVIASLRTMRYGVKDNLFDLCWVVIQFALVYSLAQRVGKERMRRFLRNLFYVVLVIWGIACCVGLYQYLFRIGYTYVANPNTTSPELTRQGYYQSRLFGLFMGLDYAAYTSMFLFVGCMQGVVTRGKHWAARAALAVAALVLVTHVILSVSRSALIALILYAFCFTVLLVRNRCGSMKQLKRLGVSVLAGVCAVVVCWGCTEGIRLVCSIWPWVASSRSRMPSSGHRRAMSPTTASRSGGTIYPLPVRSALRDCPCPTTTTISATGIRRCTSCATLPISSRIR